MAELDAEQARREAREVLADDRFHAREVPRPLRGVLTWIGDRMRDVAEPIADALSTPGGIAVTVLAVGGLAAAAAVAIVRRRNRLVVAESAASRSRSIDPSELESAADRAEAAGDHSGAVRLRFRAGLLRLSAAGAIDPPDRATTRRLLGRIDVPGLADLTTAFEAVAYGGREATAADARAARDGWRAVVAAAPRTGGRG